MLPVRSESESNEKSTGSGEPKINGSDRIRILIPGFLLAKHSFNLRFENKFEAQDADIEDKVEAMEQRMTGLTLIMEKNNKKEGTEDGPKKKEDKEKPFQAVNIESNVTRPK